MAPSRRAVHTAGAPAAIGPYSQAVRAGDVVYVSGQIPVEPSSGRLAEGNIGSQTDRVLLNLSAILEAAGGSLDDVVRTTVYLVDLADFAAMNEVYATHFNDPAPARATIGVAALPLRARLEIDAIAVIPRDV